MNTSINPFQAEKNELPAPEQTFEWPRQAMQERNWNETAKRWAVLRKAYPDHPATWFQGLNALIQACEYDRAEALLAQARRHFANHPNLYTESAVLAMCRKRWDEAENHLQKARKKFPNNLQIWMKSAECAEGKGDLEKAIAYNQKARQCAPDQPAPYIQYAELAMHAEQWDQALSRWEMLREHFPDIPAGYIRAAEAARQIGRPKEARRLILAHQYGADIFNGDLHTRRSRVQRNSLADFVRQLELIWTMAIFNLRSEVQRNYLSYGWWVLEPLLHMVVYYVVFSLLLHRGGKNFPVFLLTGLIPWMWFMKTVSSSSSSILSGQNLMIQVGMPSIVFPLVRVVQATLKQLPVFLLLFGFVWLNGFSPGVHWWALVPVIFVQATLVILFSCAIAAVIPFVRDLAYLVPTGLTFLMFLSGIFYDYRKISVEWQKLFLINPIAFLLKCYREIVMDGVLPNFHLLLYWGVGCSVAFLLLVFAYKRLRYIYPRIVME